MYYALYTLLAFVAAVILFVIVVALRPNDFTAARSAMISASPDEVFPHVNNLQAFLKWSPYEERDPEAQRTFEGPLAGVGSIYRFSGNDNFGEGSIEIVETKAPEVIRMKLEFIRPFCGNNAVIYTFEPVGDQTVVTWKLIGKYNFFTKAMGLFISMDQMIGSDFERGLAKLKTIVEAEPAGNSGGRLCAKLETISNLSGFSAPASSIVLGDLPHTANEQMSQIQNKLFSSLERIER